MLWTGTATLPSEVPVPPCLSTTWEQFCSLTAKRWAFKRLFEVHKTSRMRHNKVFCISHTKPKFCGQNVNKTNTTMKNSTFTKVAALSEHLDPTPLIYCGGAPAAVQSSAVHDAATGQAWRVIPGAPERSPDWRAGVWTASAGGEAASPSKAARAQHRLPCASPPAWSQGGTTWRHDPARRTVYPGPILPPDFHNPGAAARARRTSPLPRAATEPRRPRCPSASPGPRGECGGAAPGAPEPLQRGPAATRAPLPRLSARGARPPLPAGRGSPRCRRRGCRCSARRPWPQTPRRGRGTARCPRPAPGGALRRPRGATAASSCLHPCRPLAAEGGGAMCVGGGDGPDGARQDELINLLPLATRIRHSKCVHRT